MLRQVKSVYSEHSYLALEGQAKCWAGPVKSNEAAAASGLLSPRPQNDSQAEDPHHSGEPTQGSMDCLVTGFRENFPCLYGYEFEIRQVQGRF